MPKIGIDIEARTSKADSEISSFSKKVAAEFQKTLKLTKLESQALAQIISKKKNLLVTEQDIIKAKKIASAATKENIKLSQAENMVMDKRVGLFANMNKQIFRYRMALISVMVASYALQRVITAAWNFTYVGAQINEQVEALHRLSVRYGTTADKLIADMRRVSKETLSNAEIVKSAGKAMVMGIAPETTVKLMKIATAAARVMGKTTNEMFADITLGTARMSKKILDNIGIIVDWRSAYAKHAAQLKITVNSLSAQQKMVARTNAIIEAGEPIINTVSDALLTQRQVLDKVTASWSNWFATLKQGFINIVVPLQGLEKARKYIGDLQVKIKELEGLQKGGAGRTLWGFGQPVGEAISDLKKRLSFVKSFIDASDKNLARQEKIRQAKLQQLELDKRRSVIVKKLGKLYVKMYNDQEDVAKKTSAQIEILFVQLEKRKLALATKTQVQIATLYASFEELKLDVATKTVIQIEQLMSNFEKRKLALATKTQVQIEQLMSEFENRKEGTRRKSLTELLSFYNKIREMQYLSIRASEGTHKKLIESLTGTDKTYLENRKFIDDQIKMFKIQKLEQELIAYKQAAQLIYQNEKQFKDAIAVLDQWGLNEKKEINNEWARHHGTTTEKIKLQIEDMTKYSTEQSTLMAERLPTQAIDSFANSFSQMAVTVFNDTHSFRDAIKQMRIQFINSMVAMIAKTIALKLVQGALSVASSLLGITTISVASSEQLATTATTAHTVALPPLIALTWKLVAARTALAVVSGGASVAVPAGVATGGGVVAPAADGAIFKGGFQKFARGGIVDRPTLGLIGEGQTNEAVIPMPDNKHVPVQLSGGGGTPVIIINAIDTQSFSDAMLNNKASVIKIISDNIKDYGLVNKTIGGFV